MGLSKSKSAKVQSDVDLEWDNLASTGMKTRITLDRKVAHYTPSIFPLVPICNKNTIRVCKESWKLVVRDDPSGGNTLSGITLFYTEFYEMLDKFDNSGRFDAILSLHSSGMNKIAAKGAILIRIITFSLSIDLDNFKQTQYLLYMLGKSHSHKQIRPWQYSVFIQTLLNTLASRLGSYASDEVMSAWVNLFAFIMQTMLPPAIKDLVVETEVNSNCSMQFSDEKTNAEIMEVEEVREITKKLGGRSVNGSSYSGHSRSRANSNGGSTYGEKSVHVRAVGHSPVISGGKSLSSSISASTSSGNGNASMRTVPL